jgi:hypothetical protein
MRSTEFTAIRDASASELAAGVGADLVEPW